MDYSPYRKQSRGFSAYSSAGVLGVFLVSGIIGFLIFWGVKAFFFRELGEISLPTVQPNESSVSVQIKGIDGWSMIGKSDTSMALSEGDSIKSSKGDDAVLMFKNGTKAFLGLGGELFITESRENSDGELFGDITLVSGPVVFDFDGKFDKDELFKVWLSDNIYVLGASGTVLLTSNGVHLVKGEKATVVSTDEFGKVLKNKEIGIGQSIDIKTFALQAIPESVKYLPLYNLHSQTPVTIPEPEASPEPEVSPEVVIIEPPIITSPTSNGEIITIKTVPQTLQGTAPANAKKIMIEWENSDGKVDPYVLKNFTGATNVWKYSASPQFNTISAGKNTYRVYAIDENEVKSTPTSIIIEYTPSGTSENVYTTFQGNLTITTPNNGNATVQSSSIIALKGTAPVNATYITVVNSTLGSEYTLQKYVKGSGTWWYETGNMNPGKYNFIVKATNSSRQTLSSDTISVTVTESSVATPAPIATTTPVPTPQSTDEITR